MIDGCSFSGVRVGVLVQDGARADVADCTIEEATESAIEVVGEDTHAVIRMNRITDSEVGLAISAGASARIEDNEIDVRGTGISIEETGSPYVIDTTVISDSSAIVIDGASPRVRGNSIAGGSRAVLLAAGQETAPHVAGNSIAGGNDGIVIESGADGTFTGNAISDNEEAGILVRVGVRIRRSSTTSSAVIRGSSTAISGASMSMRAHRH